MEELLGLLLVGFVIYGIIRVIHDVGRQTERAEFLKTPEGKKLAELTKVQAQKEYLDRIDSIAALGPDALFLLNGLFEEEVVAVPQDAMRKERIAALIARIEEIQVLGAAEQAKESEGVAEATEEGP